ncbi:MAG TPA: RNHCP domain-containing protein [Candidatus Dojkabacteria bacterium]|nr:RNHCP domain-containing protein [Candidatus Dojkabacteria bacterium]
MGKFVRKIENFVCENCNTENVGDGYTDHCSKCLYSKHVDINPGDRSSGCKGLMKPVFVDMHDGKYRIYYECEKCGYTHKVTASENDNFEEILKLTGHGY